jgi:excisionase family DNA binding protein
VTIRDYVTIPKAADLLGVTRTTIRNWVLKGDIASVSLGGVRRAITLKELDRFDKDGPLPKPLRKTC